MNERIKELDAAAQEYAGRIVGNDEDSNYTEWFNVYKAKFAESIVNECADVCYTHGWGMLEHGMPGHNLVDDCGTMIKQYFGVEE